MTAIYLDYNATTPVDPQVLDAMLPYLVGGVRQPILGLCTGQRAHEAVERARAEVAQLIGAAPVEIVFTGGATEATSIAIRGAVTLDGARTGIVTTNIEHPATDACCHLLQRSGYDVRRVPAESSGIVSTRARGVSDRLENRDRHRHPGAERDRHASSRCATLRLQQRSRRALVHADSAQAVGKIPVNVKELGVDLLTMAGHMLLRAQGHRRAVRAQRRDVAAGGCRRRPGARPAAWHRERGFHRRARRRVRACCACD